MNTKISALTSGVPAQAGDLIPIDRSGNNFSITASSIAALASSAWASLSGDLTETQVIPWDGATPGTHTTGISRTADGTLAIGNGTQGNASGTLELAKVLAGAGTYLAPSYSFSSAPASGLFLDANSVPSFAFAPTGVGYVPALRITSYQTSGTDNAFEFYNSYRTVNNFGTHPSTYITADGGFFSETYAVISGYGSGSPNQILPPSSDSLMLGVWADVTGPAIQTRANTSATTDYNYSNLNSAGYYTMSIEQDGHLQFGSPTCASHAAMDSGFSRIGIASFTLGTAVAGDYSGSLTLNTLSFGHTATIPAQVQQTGSYQNSSVTTLTTSNFPNSVGKGNTVSVVIEFIAASNSVSTVIDSLGNHYTRAVPTTYGAGTLNTLAMEVWCYIGLPTGGTNAVTITMSSPVTQLRIFAQEISGVSAVGPYNSGIGTSGAITTSNITTVYPHAFLHALGFNGVDGSTTVGTGWNKGVTELSVWDEWEVVGSTGTYAAHYNAGSPADWLCILIAYYANTDVSTISWAATNTLQIGNTGGTPNASGTLELGATVMTAAAPTVSASQVGFGGTVAATANTTGGGLTLPLLAAGYLIINVAGTQFKVPYYAN